MIARWSRHRISANQIREAVLEATGPCLILVAAWLVYNPVEAAPLPIVDFTEFLPHLESRKTLPESFHALWEYYRGLGRTSPLHWVHITATWSIFGTDPLGWDLSIFALPALSVILMYALLRLIGVGRLPSSFATTLLVTGRPMVATWERMTGEAIAVAALLGLAIYVVQCKRRHATPALLVVLGFGVAISLSKDALGALGLVATFLAYFYAFPGRQQRRISWGQKETWAILGTFAFLFLLVLSGAIQDPNAEYGGRYGTSGFDLRMVLRGLQLLAVPIAGWSLALAVIFAAVLVHYRSHYPKELWLGPVIGIALYMPWPRWNEYLMAPFFLSVVLATGMLLNKRGGRTDLALRYSVITAVIAFSGLNAWSYSRASSAVRYHRAHLLTEVERVPEGSLIIVLDDEADSTFGSVAYHVRMAIEHLYPDRLVDIHASACGTEPEGLRWTLELERSGCGARPVGPNVRKSPYPSIDWERGVVVRRYYWSQLSAPSSPES